MAEIFISYSHKDEDLSKQFHDALIQKGHGSFLAGESIKLGDEWAEKVDVALEKCDYFVLLLSERSSESEMVLEEVRRVKEFRESRPDKRPKILTIRVEIPMDHKLNYDLGGYINRYQHLLWKDESDTKPILKEIYNVIETGRSLELEKDVELPEADQGQSKPVPVAPLEVPGGTVQIDSPFYMARNGEAQFIDTITQPGALLRINAPRQFGKTSLLSRVINKARAEEYKVVALSFQLFNQQVIQSLDDLLKQLCAQASRKCGYPNKVAEFWEDEYLDNNGKCSAYFEEYLLEQSDKPILLALDEADRLFEYSDVSSDFFGMMRYWHEEAKNNPIWQRLRIGIAYSTEAYLAIKDLNQSPFNVGLERKLAEFEKDQVAELSKLHGLNLKDTEIDDLIKMIGGHPYLTRKAFHIMTEEGQSLKDFLDTAANEDGPFDDHLRRHHWILTHKFPEMGKAFLEIIKNNHHNDPQVCNKLRAAGLIHGSSPDVRPSFEIYNIFFKNRLR